MCHPSMELSMTETSPTSHIILQKGWPCVKKIRILQCGQANQKWHHQTKTTTAAASQKTVRVLCNFPEIFQWAWDLRLNLLLLMCLQPVLALTINWQHVDHSGTPALHQLRRQTHPAWAGVCCSDLALHCSCQLLLKLCIHISSGGVLGLLDHHIGNWGSAMLTWSWLWWIFCNLMYDSLQRPGHHQNSVTAWQFGTIGFHSIDHSMDWHIATLFRVILWVHGSILWLSNGADTNVVWGPDCPSCQHCSWEVKLLHTQSLWLGYPVKPNMCFAVPDLQCCNQSTVSMNSLCHTQDVTCQWCMEVPIWECHCHWVSAVIGETTLTQWKPVPVWWI